MTDRLTAGVRALAARFRRQRPLRANSLIITIFGDAITPRGGAVTLGSLIELASPFGLSERLVRTSVGRLADDGWLDNRRVGRLSEYRLSSEGRARFSEATRRIYGVPGREWSGRWTLVIVPHATGTLRARARRALAWAGFGEIAPGVFAHPTMSPQAAEAERRRSQALDGALILTTGEAADPAHRQLAALGWDLAELSARYRRFVAAFEPALAELRTGTTLRPAAAFLMRTLLIHEYRRIHLRDPLLPEALLPTRWIGTAAYRLCRTLYGEVVVAAEVHLSRVANRLDGALPGAGSELHDRCGGLGRNGA